MLVNDLIMRPNTRIMSLNGLLSYSLQMIQESNSVMHDYFLRKWTAWRRQLNTES